MARHQLAFTFGQVERQAVGFTERSNHVNHEGRQQTQQPSRVFLGIYDGRSRHGARHDKDRDQRGAHGQLVRNHLGGGAHRTQQRVRRVRRPTTQHDAVNPESTDGQNHQGCHRGVKDLERSRDTENLYVGTHRDDGQDRESGEGRDQRSQEVNELVRTFEPEVLFEDHLARIGHRLEQTQRTVYVGPGASLDTAQAAPLYPQLTQHTQHQQDQHHHGLDQGNPPGFLAEIRWRQRRNRRNQSMHLYTSAAFKVTSEPLVAPRVSCTRDPGEH